MEECCLFVIQEFAKQTILCHLFLANSAPLPLSADLTDIEVDGDVRCSSQHLCMINGSNAFDETRFSEVSFLPAPLL